jgi:hypothetical protein
MVWLNSLYDLMVVVFVSFVGVELLVLPLLRETLLSVLHFFCLSFDGFGSLYVLLRGLGFVLAIVQPTNKNSGVMNGPFAFRFSDRSSNYKYFWFVAPKPQAQEVLKNSPKFTRG